MTNMPANFSLRSYDGCQAAHSHPHDQIVLSDQGTLEIQVEEGSDVIVELVPPRNPEIANLPRSS